MLMAFTLRSTLLGLSSWLIPFTASLLFFDRSGQLIIAQPLFKSIMVIAGGLSGAALLVVAIPWTNASPFSGFALGCYWLAINLLLDLVVLVAFMKMPLTLHLPDIGLRYLLIPIISTSMAVAAARARTGPRGRS